MRRAFLVAACLAFCQQKICGSSAFPSLTQNLLGRLERRGSEEPRKSSGTHDSCAQFDATRTDQQAKVFNNLILHYASISCIWTHGFTPSPNLLQCYHYFWFGSDILLHPLHLCKALFLFCTTVPILKETTTILMEGSQELASLSAIFLNLLR